MLCLCQRASRLLGELGDTKLKIRKTLLGKTQDGIRCYEVSGNSVRKSDTSFCLGAHWLARKYIPEGEVWVENTGNREDQLANLIHEIHEVRDMRDNGLDYETAHVLALKIEHRVRNNGRVDKMIREYLKEE